MDFRGQLRTNQAGAACLDSDMWDTSDLDLTANQSLRHDGESLRRTGLSKVRGLRRSLEKSQGWGTLGYGLVIILKT
jgi:hypothetical protein